MYMYTAVHIYIRIHTCTCIHIHVYTRIYKSILYKSISHYPIIIRLYKSIYYMHIHVHVYHNTLPVSTATATAGTATTCIGTKQEQNSRDVPVLEIPSSSGSAAVGTKQEGIFALSCFVLSFRWQASFTESLDRSACVHPS